MKRTRDDEPAASAGAVARQKQGDGTVWDWVRVHRVGAAGMSVAGYAGVVMSVVSVG